MQYQKCVQCTYKQLTGMYTLYVLTLLLMRIALFPQHHQQP